MDDKSDNFPSKARDKSPEQLLDICKRLKSQFESLDPSTNSEINTQASLRAAADRASELKRKLLLELLKQQLVDLSR